MASEPQARADDHLGWMRHKVTMGTKWARISNSPGGARCHRRCPPLLESGFLDRPNGLVLLRPHPRSGPGSLVPGPYPLAGTDVNGVLEEGEVRASERESRHPCGPGPQGPDYRSSPVRERRRHGWGRTGSTPGLGPFLQVHESEPESA